MLTELFVSSVMSIDGEERMRRNLPAKYTGKWRVINKDGEAKLYLEVVYTNKRREATGKTKGFFFKESVYEYIDHEVTEFVSEHFLVLKITYDNECGYES